MSDGDAPFKCHFTTRMAVGFALAAAGVALLWIWSVVAATLAVEASLDGTVPGVSLAAAGTSTICWVIVFQACFRQCREAAERAAILDGTLAELGELRARHVEMVRGVAGMVRRADLDEMDGRLAQRDGLILAVLREVAARMPPAAIASGDAALPDGMAAQIYEMGRRTGAKGHGNGAGRN